MHRRNPTTAYRDLKSLKMPFHGPSMDPTDRCGLRIATADKAYSAPSNS